MKRLLLKVEDLRVNIGPLYIVQGVSLELDRGECFALIGRNGAGKTTLIKGMLGIVGPVSGSIMFDGTEILGMRPSERSRLGIGYIPDTRRIFSGLTVEENLILASLRDGSPDSDMLERVYTLLPDLKRLRRLRAGALSGGQQQLLNIGRVLVQRHNKLVLADEPTEGLSPIYVSKVEGIFKELLEDGTSIILVEGKPSLIKSLAHRFGIMSSGRIVVQGSIDMLLANPELLRRYVGVSL